MCFARYAPLEDQDAIVGLMNFLKASSHEHGDDFVEHTFNLCGAECHAAVFAGCAMGRTAAIVTQEFRGDCGEHGRSLLPVM